MRLSALDPASTLPDSRPTRLFAHGGNLHRDLRRTIDVEESTDETVAGQGRKTQANGDTVQVVTLRRTDLPRAKDLLPNGSLTHR